MTVPQATSPDALTFSLEDSLQAHKTARIPDHELLQIIGRGAYGEVWLACHKTLNVLRAVKLVRRSSFDEERPFRRELEGIRQYEPISRAHPNLVPILHVGGSDEFLYYVMELAEAANLPDQPYRPRTLRSELKKHGALPISRVLELALGLASGLSHLHSNALVHRDVKPSNVIFVDGIPKLADIGLVTAVGDSHSFVGTEGYVPPEGPGTPSADCYSLGKLLYELSTGQDRTAWPEPALDLTYRPDREQLLELNVILHKSCAPEPQLRFQSGQEMREELEMLQRGESVKRKRSREQRWFLPKQILRFGTRIGSATSAAATALEHRLRNTDLQSPNPEVNHLVEKGHLCALAATHERLRQAANYFEQALRLQPKFIPAYTGLFRVHLIEITALPNPADSSLPSLRSAASKLVELAPDSAESPMATSLIKFLQGNLKDALIDIANAAGLPALSKQTRAVRHALYGSYLLNSGQPESALIQFQASEKEVPTCAIVQVYLGHPNFVRRGFDLALKQYQRSIELEPRQSLGYYWQAKTFEETGELMKAIEMSEQADLHVLEDEARLNVSATSLATEAITVRHQKLREAFQGQGQAGYWRARLQNALEMPRPDAHHVATIYARLGRLTDAYQWLIKAFEQRALNGLCFDLCWDPRDRRFRDIARQVGLLA